MNFLSHASAAGLCYRTSTNTREKFMMKNKWGLMSAFLFITATAWAANQVFTDKAPSSIKIENSQQGLGVETTEVKYITSFLPDYAKQLLIKVTTTIHFDTG